VVRRRDVKGLRMANRVLITYGPTEFVAVGSGTAKALQLDWLNPLAPADNTAITAVFEARPRGDPIHAEI
jgi:hypothetical protein